MQIPSITFGKIELDENEIYSFESGIPGIRDINKYFLLEPEESHPFKWVHAAQPSYLSIMCINPVLIQPDYQLRLGRSDRDELEVTDASKLMCFSLIVVPNDPRKMTANLLAPIVLNPENKKGAQVVIDGPKEMLRVQVIQE